MYPRRGRREVFLALLSTAVVVYVSWYVTRDSTETVQSMVGKPAPEIEIPAEGGEHSRLSKKEGSVVLLNFWASWCAPCMEEMPSLRMLETHFQNKGFVLFAINVGEAATIRERIKGGILPQNVVFEAEKAALDYKVKKLPLSILIDRNGSVREVFEGPRDWMRVEMIRKIEELLR